MSQTLQEQAKELVNEFMNVLYQEGNDADKSICYQYAKQCALICVDEILKAYEHIDENIIKRKEKYRPLEEYDHYTQLRTEIENL